MANSKLLNSLAAILLVVGTALAIPPRLVADSTALLFGTYNNTSKAITVDSNGKLVVSCSNCGGAGSNPGGLDTQVQFNNATAFDGSSALTWVSPALTIGVSSGGTGALKLKGNTSGTVTFTVGAAAGTYTLTFPNSAGSSNQVLSTNGSGTLSWVDQSSGTPGGSSGNLQTNNGSGSFGAYAGATCTNQALRVLSASGAGTCATITSSFVDNTIALTGTDINTSNQVTATHLASALPSAQGGTASAFFTVAGPASSAKTFTFPNASATVLTDNAVVTVAQGGTGVTGSGYTTDGVFYYNGTTFTSTGAGTSGQVLTSNGAGVAPTYQTVSGTGTVTHASGALTAGAVVIGNASADLKVDTGCSTDGAGVMTCVSFVSSGTNGGGDLTEGTGAGLTAASGHDLFWADSTAHAIKVNYNNGTTTTLATYLNKLSVFATTTSSELAGVLSDVTGSGGGFMRATGPTMTSPTIGTTATLSFITGSTQCLHVNSSGVISGTGSDCGSGNGTGTYAAVRAYSSSNLTISHTSATPMTFNANSYDPATMHSTSSNTDRIVSGTSGSYSIKCGIRTDASSGFVAGEAVYLVILKYNSSNVLQDEVARSTFLVTSSFPAANFQAVGDIYLAATDYVVCSALVNGSSDRTLTIDTASGQTKDTAWFSANLTDPF